MKEIKRKIGKAYIQNIYVKIEDSTPEFLVDFLLDWLEEYIMSGVKVSNEETLQYGFSLLRFKIINEALFIEAPDYVSLPLRWTENLSKMFYIFKEQKYTIESYDLELQGARIQDTAIVGKYFEDEPFLMSRNIPSDKNPKDSGWFIGSLKNDVDNNDPNNLSLMSLYEVGLKQPLLLPYLFFPVNCIIVFKNGQIKILKDEFVIEPKEGSYSYKKRLIKN